MLYGIIQCYSNFTLQFHINVILLMSPYNDRKIMHAANSNQRRKGKENHDKKPVNHGKAQILNIT